MRRPHRGRRLHQGLEGGAGHRYEAVPWGNLGLRV